MTVTYPDEPRPPAPRRGRRGLRAFAVLVLLVLLGGGATVAWAAWAYGGGGHGKPVRVNIPEGASAASIAERLETAGVIRSALVFRLASRVQGVAGDLKPGVYDLQTGLGVGGVIDMLQKGIEPEVFRFTIPEGKTVVEIARIIEDATEVSARDFLHAARSGRYRTDIMPKGSKNLEGLLFPKTYDVEKDATAGQIVQLLLRQFERETAGLRFERARRFDLTPYEVVILASLIEREARVAKEQRIVSSVIHNRLRKPMRLQIDATIQYVYLLRNGKVKDPLTFDDYKLDSPYNTYKIDGLPPTPIASPGLGALGAALNPADTPYYYYVLINERGEHCFSRTGAEHQACIRRRDR